MFQIFWDTSDDFACVFPKWITQLKATIAHKPWSIINYMRSKQTTSLSKIWFIPCSFFDSFVDEICLTFFRQTAAISSFILPTTTNSRLKNLFRHEEKSTLLHQSTSLYVSSCKTISLYRSIVFIKGYRTCYFMMKWVNKSCLRRW